MKSLITLKPDQRTRLENNEQVGLCIPIKQPPDSCIDITGDIVPSWLEDVIQYPINKVLGVRGTDYHVKVVGNSVKRVQEVTYKEILDTCILTKTGSENKIWENPDSEAHDALIADFADWFNSQFSEPRPRREKGKIVRYECWAWDMESWEEISFNDPHYRFSGANWHYKNKPLEIHVNPFYEFFTIRLEVK